MEKREKLGSRLGFILLSAGCAIGLGNVWTFPWRVGNSGGGAFLVLYLLVGVLIGIPVMTMEFALGRGSQKSPVKMLDTLQQKGQKWGFSGWVSLAGNFFLMMFYTTIAGYFFYYFGKVLANNTTDLTFANTIANTPVNVGFMLVVVIVGFLVLTFDLQKGLEKVTKIMMVALFVLMIVLAIHSCTLSGASEGLTFYLKPDLSKISGKTLIAAFNQCFFSLSLGMGSMAIFGSYIGKDRSLMGESVNVFALDTLAALLAGLIIFPACFTYDINVGAGPELLFTTMVSVFNNMDGGNIWGGAFFLFMIFAAMSTVLAVFENILSMVRDLTGWSRKKGCLILCVAMILLSLPMALEGSVFANFQPFTESSGQGLGFLDLWSTIVEKIIQPFGSVAFVIFCTTRYGWGWDRFMAEANAGSGLKVKKWMRPLFGIFVPLVVGGVMVYGLVTYGW